MEASHWSNGKMIPKLIAIGNTDKKCSRLKSMTMNGKFKWIRTGAKKFLADCFT
jgi:hypothetical protein